MDKAVQSAIVEEINKHLSEFNQSLTLKKLLTFCRINTSDSFPDIRLESTAVQLNNKGTLNVACKFELKSDIIPRFKFDPVKFSINLVEKSYAISCKSKFDFGVELNNNPVTAEAELSISKKAKEKSNSSIKGAVLIKKSRFEFSTNLSSDQKAVKFICKDLQLSQAAKSLLNTSLPEIIPDVMFKQAELEWINKNLIKISADTQNKSELNIAGSDLQIRKLDLKLEKKKTNKYPSASINLDFGLNLGDTIIIKNGKFSFAYKYQKEASSWEVNNELDLILCDELIKTKSKYSKAKTETLELTAANLPALNFTDELKLKTSKMIIKLERNEKKQTVLDYESDSTLKTPSVVLSKGKVKLHKESGKLTFKFTDSSGTLKFSKLVEKGLNTRLPAGIPDFALNEFSYSWQKGKEWKFGFKVSNTEKLNAGNSDLLISRISFGLSKKESVKNPSVKLDTDFSLNLQDIVKIEKGKFAFEYLAGKEVNTWKLNNSMSLSLFENVMKVAASYEKGESDCIKLKVDKIPQIGFIDGIYFDTTNAFFSITRTKDKSADFQLSATSEFVNPLGDFGKGTLKLSGKKDDLKFTYSSDISFDFKFEESGDLPYFNAGNPKFEIAYNKKKKDFTAGGSLMVKFKNVPDVVSRIFPAESATASVELSASRCEFGINLGGKMTPIPVPPHVEGVGLEEVIDLGNAYLGVNDFKIVLKKDPEISANVYVGLPAKLNSVFKDSKGKQIEIFKTCPKGDYKDALRLSMTLANSGFTLKVLDTPFKKFKLEDGKFTINMKNMGEISFHSPRFSLSDGKLKASGAVSYKDLALSLTLIKWFLKKINMPDTSNLLNAKIPLKGIDFAKKVNGKYKFKSDSFLDLFVTDKKKLNMPGWLKDAFRTFDKAADLLPDAMLEYGNYKIPDYLSFDLEFSNPNNLSFRLSVKDPDRPEEAIPIMLLLPHFPMFYGIKLYSIGFGELMNGTLFNVDIDVEVDMFDIPRLVAATGINRTLDFAKDYLPDPKTLHQKFRIKNLVTLIIYQTEIPIPVPLFYDEISGSTISFEGTENKMHLEFPMPSFGLNEIKNISLIVKEFTRFMKDPANYKIEWDKFSEADFVKLTVGENYAKLPKYIAKQIDENSGKYVGAKFGNDEPFTLGPIKILTAIISAIQDGSINKLIKTIELKRRMDNLELKVFECIDVNTKYAFTTPFEFVTQAAAELQMDENNSDNYLALLPPQRTKVKEASDQEDTTISINEKTEGLVTYFNGSSKIGSLFNSKNTVGLIFTENGFATGAMFDINIDGKIKALVRGHTIITNDSLNLGGEASFELFNINIFNGSFNLDKSGFIVRSQAGPKNNELFYLNGNLEGEYSSSRFYLEGTAEITQFSFKSEGSVLIEFTGDKQIFKADADYSILDNLITLHTESYFFANEYGSEFKTRTDFSIQNFMDAQVTGRISSGIDKLELNGDISLDFLGKNVLNATCDYSNGKFAYEGNLNLFPGTDLINIGGRVHGEISADNFSISGNETGVRIYDAPFTDSNIKVIRDGERIELKLHGSLWGVNYYFNGYVEEQDGKVLVMRGGVERITWLNLLTISNYNGSGGPEIEVIVSEKNGLEKFFLTAAIEFLGLVSAKALLNISQEEWEVNIKHSVELAHFARSEFNLALYIKPSIEVLGAASLNTEISLVIPPVKFGIKIFGRRIETTIIPEINLGTLSVAHNLKFHLYRDGDIVAEHRRLKSLLDAQRAEMDKNNTELREAEAQLKSEKERGYRTYVNEMTDRYNAYKKNHFRNNEEIIETKKAELEDVIKKIFNDLHTSDQDENLKAASEKIESYFEHVLKIGYNKFSNDNPVIDAKKRLLDFYDEILLQHGTKKVLIQQGIYTLDSTGSGEKTSAMLRNYVSGDEFELRFAGDHVNIVKDNRYLYCGVGSISSGPDYAYFTNKKPVDTSVRYTSDGTPLVYMRDRDSVFDSDIRLNLDYPEDKGFRIQCRGYSLVRPGGSNKYYHSEWRNKDYGDRFKFYILQEGNEVSAHGMYKIMNDNYFLSRLGRSDKIVKADFRNNYFGDPHKIHIMGRDDKPYYEIINASSGDYHLVVPGGGALRRNAQFRNYDTGDRFYIEYNSSKKGYNIRYKDHYLVRCGGSGEYKDAEFRKNESQDTFRIYRELHTDAGLKAIKEIRRRINDYGNGWDNRLRDYTDSWKNSYGLMDHPDVDGYFKTRDDYGKLFYLEEKVFHLKEKQLKYNQEIQRINNSIKAMESQLSSSDLHFWMEFGSEFSFSSIHFKLPDIRINFTVGRISKLEDCLEEIPKAVIILLRENALNIFTGKGIKDNRKRVEYSALISRGGNIEQSRNSYEQLDKEYYDAQDQGEQIVESLDDFLE